jgi:iron(III) transport system substrate-binding protein
MNKNRTHVLGLLATLLIGIMTLAACGSGSNAPQSVAEPASPDEQTLMIYSGRNENLVGPLIEQFQEQTGITVQVRYGGTAELAATILEEGTNSPADVFFGQDAGALGALAKSGRFTQLPDEVLNLVPARFRSRDGLWIGTSGRARVFVYNTDMLSESDLPDDHWGLTDPKWKGKVGWAPTNGSFQAFVTALRKLEGEDQARAWLQAMIDNDVQSYPKNTPIVDATARGEIQIGLVNHYYLYRFIAEQGDAFPARNYHPRKGGASAIINVAGVGILNTSKHTEAAKAFVTFLLSDAAQSYVANTTFEYPLVEGIPINEKLTPLDQLNLPELDLSDLDDLQGTLELLQEVGALD